MSRDRTRETEAVGKPSLARALAELWRLIMRSKAPQLRLRTAAALALTMAGKVLASGRPFFSVRRSIACPTARATQRRWAFRLQP
jgi:hypothetical protein